MVVGGVEVEVSDTALWILEAGWCLIESKTPYVGIGQNSTSIVTLLKKYLIQTHHINVVLEEGEN